MARWQWMLAIAVIGLGIVAQIPNSDEEAMQQAGQMPDVVPASGQEVVRFNITGMT